MSATFQRGDPRQHMIPVALAKAVAEGDVVGIASGALTKASETTWTADLATTRAAFVATFAGRAAQDKDADGVVYGNGETFKLRVRVDTSGVCRYAAKDGTYALGDLLGPAKQAGNLLEDQILEKVASEAQATHRVAGLEGVNPGHVDAEILSRVFRAAAAT